MGEVSKENAEKLKAARARDPRWSQEPSRYPELSWRWLLFDRRVSIRWSGHGDLPEGVEAGDIAGYFRYSWKLAAQHKFHKSYWFVFHYTTLKMQCGCTRRYWRRKPILILGDCPKHGLEAMHERAKETRRKKGLQDTP